MKQYWKRILLMAVPVMLSNLISQFQMLIDKMFLGGLDITYMSAVGNATSPMWTTMNTIFSLSMGATILISQAYGANERDRAKAITASMFKHNNVLGILLFLFWFFIPQVAFQLMGVDESIIDMSITYARIYSPIFILTGLGASVSSMLQASQKTTIMVAYGLVRSLLNVILDYTLIFGHFGFKAMGVGGAALATVIAELVGDVVVIAYVMKSKELWLKPTFMEIIKSKASLYGECLKLGAPTACEEFAWNFSNLYLIAMLNQVSVEAAGIHSIIFGIECVPVVIIGAIGMATLSISGYETGGGNKRGVWDVSMVSFAMSIAVSLLTLVAFLLLPQQILGIFTKDSAILAAAPVYLLIVGIDLFPKAGNIIFGDGIKGYGNPLWMLGTQIFGTIFIMVFSSIMVLIFHMGMTELFILVVADETIRASLNFFKLRSIRDK